MYEGKALDRLVHAVGRVDGVAWVSPTAGRLSYITRSVRLDPPLLVNVAFYVAVPPDGLTWPVSPALNRWPSRLPRTVFFTL